MPSSVRSLQASGLTMEATMNGPSHLLCIFSFLFGLQDSVKHEISFPYLSGLHFLVLPPSRFFLVLAKVDCSLYLARFDRVDRRLYVFFYCVGPFACSPRFELDFLWCDSLLAIQQLEWGKFCGPRLYRVVGPDHSWQLIDPFSLQQLGDVFLYAREDDAIGPLHRAI